MHNKISQLPIALNRKATIYNGADVADSDIFYDFISDDNVVLCSDGTNVEYLLSFLIDERRLPFSELQIELAITARELWDYTQGEDTYVDIVLLTPNKVGVFITTQHDVIYDEEHTIR